MEKIKKNKKHNVIVIGCGRFGSTIAGNLSELNKNLMIVDMDQSSFRKLSSSYGGLTKEGDGTDIDLLESIGIATADVVIVSTDKDDANILISQIAKVIYKVPDVIARIYDTSKKITCDDFGIHVISPTDLSIKEFQKKVFSEGVEL
ncbi:MAG: TrkA family potassium uptake protein [Firmicutes bacterium]|nr:TrkA family potassium uptake protein [Bacillota bacterium]